MDRSLKKKVLLYTTAALYITAGIFHFIFTKRYVDIMPAWLPAAVALVYISGLCELIGGLLLIPSYTRRFAAWGIIALLIAVFPANIQMTIDYFQTNNSYKWITIARLPFQPLLIYWAWKFTRKRKEVSNM